MITVNGRKFAATEKEMVESLFRAGGTACGFYRTRHRKGRTAIVLYNQHRDPMALISPDACIVTAYKRDDGRSVYMYGMTRTTEDWLGLRGISMCNMTDIAEAALAQVTQG